MTIITLDIPGTVLEYDHAGAGVDTGIVGGAAAVSVDDGGVTYVRYHEVGLTGGTAGYDLFIDFPPTTLAGTLISTSLVVSAKGTDSRTGSVPYDMANFGEVLTRGPIVLLNKRDEATYYTPPDYGYIDPGGAFMWGWVAVDGLSGSGPRGDESVDYVTTITPLTGPNSNVRDDPPTGTEEFVTEESLAAGHVEYNPDGGLYFSDLNRGSGAHPSADADIFYNYIALRVTYEGSTITGSKGPTRRQFYEAI